MPRKKKESDPLAPEPAPEPTSEPSPEAPPEPPPEAVQRKRGRKPIPDEEKKTKRSGKRAATQPEPQPEVTISYVTTGGPGAAGSSTDPLPAPTQLPPTEAPKTTPLLRASEVIRLLNTSQSAAIPARAKSPTHEALVEPTQRFLAESDSDDDAADRQKTTKLLGKVSSDQVIELLGAHTTKSQWPTSTKALCHTCCHPFDTIPIMLPTVLRNGKFDRCTGNFCSFNCAKRHALDLRSYRSTEICSLVSYLYKRVVGRGRMERVPIIPAPPRSVLAPFGGCMTIEEYRQGALVLPPAESTLPERHRIVSVLQHNCIPVFARAHYRQESSVYNDVFVPRTNTKHFERTQPIHTSTMQESMSIRTFLRQQ